MRVAIAGAGMAGAYLYRLMKVDGIDSVVLFDEKKTNRCGHKPCAWGVAPVTEYRRLVGAVAEPRDYELKHSDHIIIDGVRMKADMLTIDKARLISDLVGGDVVRHDRPVGEDFDRIIDATGVARAFLEPTRGPEVIADCIQYRISNESDLGMWFKTSGLGYEWCFPLGNNEYHLGFGNLAARVKDYRPVETGVPPVSLSKIRCKCNSRVRLTSPFHSQPFVSRGKVVGIGESIGTVGPLGADGNLYAMQSAEMLLDHWDDLEGYSEAILKRFDWMRKERKVLDKLVGGQVPSIADARTFVAHGKRIGIGMGPVEALRLFKKAMEGRRIPPEEKKA